MKLIKIHIEFDEGSVERRQIIDTIFAFYAINGVMAEAINDGLVNGLIFNMYSRDLALMRHDIKLLRIAGYRIKEVRGY